MEASTEQLVTQGIVNVERLAADGLAARLRLEGDPVLQGAFELSDPISKWLPEFAETRSSSTPSATTPPWFRRRMSGVRW